MIYLDSAATTPVSRAVLEAMWPALTSEFGNPSSTHDLGHSAAEILAGARAAIAEVLGCRASEVVFTSGGTEGDNFAVKGLALAGPRGRHIVTSSVEHPAVLESCDYLARLHGFDLTVVGVDARAVVDVRDVVSALRPDTSLVSVMYANNEVGTVQPLAEIAAAAHSVGALVHTDAVQAAGSLDLDVRALGVDALTISGHKIGAPKGIGAVWVRGGIPVEPLLHGGGQERGRRSGTENVAAAVGLAVALTTAESGRLGAARDLAARRDQFIGDVLGTVPGARLTGSREHRLPGHASFTFEGISGEALLLSLERAGIIGSSGSACAAGRDDPSPTLLAMGVTPELAQTAVRFTFDAAVTTEQLAETAAQLRAAVTGLSPRS